MEEIFDKYGELLTFFIWGGLQAGIFQLLLQMVGG